MIRPSDLLSLAVLAAGLHQLVWWASALVGG